MVLVEPKDEYLIVSSSPYVKMCNLVSDRALYECWEVQLRKKDCNIFTTVVRRQYIPPLLVTY